ncbi:MAG: hypothetical protein FJW40_20515 [Acidobacteria bacterium]|nr:hypothetical protein [Acidobacteriota bacterium]
MSSAAQVAANQANSQHSTGPRTAEGKAAAARNSLRHGLNATQLVIAPGEEADFEHLKAELLADLVPSTATEEVHFNDILHAVWNKRRVRLLEAQLADSHPEAIISDELEPKFDRLRRYFAHHDRVHHRALAELRRLQTERLARQPQLDASTSVLARSEAALRQTLARVIGSGPTSNLDRIFFETVSQGYFNHDITPPLQPELASFRNAAPEAE